jgi:hypothetical protein
LLRLHAIGPLARSRLLRHGDAMSARHEPQLPTAEEATALAGRALTLALLALVPCCGVQLVPASFAALFAQRARRALVVRGTGGGALLFADASLLLAGLVIAANVALLGLAAVGAIAGERLRETIAWEELDTRGFPGFALRRGTGGFGGAPSSASTMPKRVVTTNEPLRDQLAKAAREAEGGRRVVVMTSYDGCSACDEVWATFDDPLLHHALPEVSVIRVDVEVFSVEMGELGMMREAHPWFFLLDAEGRPSAAVSADAWPENVPMNVAKGLRDWLDEAKQKPNPGTISL